MWWGYRSRRRKEPSPFCDALTPQKVSEGTQVRGAGRVEGRVPGRPLPSRRVPCWGAQCRSAGRDGPGREASRRSALVWGRTAPPPPFQHSVLMLLQMSCPKPGRQLLPTPVLPGQGFAQGETENAKASPQPGRREGLPERPGGGPQRVPGVVGGHTPWPGLRVKCQLPSRLPRKQGGRLARTPHSGGVQWQDRAPETSTQAQEGTVGGRVGCGAQPRPRCAATAMATACPSSSCC